MAFKRMGASRVAVVMAIFSDKYYFEKSVGTPPELVSRNISNFSIHLNSENTANLKMLNSENIAKYRKS